VKFGEVASLRTRKYLIPIWAIGRERPEDFRCATIQKLTWDTILEVWEVSNEMYILWR